jgi:hypothetical protein
MAKASIAGSKVNAQIHGFLVSDLRDLLEMLFVHGGGPILQELEVGCFRPVLGCVAELFHEGLEVSFIVEVIGVNGCVPDQVRGFGNVAPLWRGGV